MRKIILPSVFTAVDKVSSVVNGMGKNVSSYATKTDDAIARSNRKFRKLGNTAFDVAGKSALIGTAIVAPMALAVKSTADFEAQMSNVGTLIDTNVESIDKMGQQILDIAKTIPVPIEELTASLYDIRSAGIPAERAMSTLKDSAKLAQAGLGTTSEATNIMTSALNAFASEGLTSAQTADILFKTVKAGKTTISALAQSFGATAPVIQSAGVSLADFQAATAALTTAGTPATQAQTQLRASIVALQKPTKEMEAIFARLGVSSEKDLIKKFGGLGGAFKAVNDAGTDMGLNLSKAWSSVEAASAVTSITGATNVAYVNTLNDMTKGANAVETAFEKQSKTTASQAQLARNNIQALTITLGTTLIPIINGLLGVVTPIINKFSNWAKENRGTVETIVKVAAVMGGLAFTISAVAFGVGLYTKAALIANKAVKAWMATEKLRNAIMSLSPTQKMIGLIGLLATAYISLSRNTSKASIEQKAFDDIQRAVIEKTVNQRIEIDKLFKSLAFAEKGSAKFNSILEKIDQIQPGITKKYNLQEGAIKNLASAHQELIKSIEERARAEAASELYVQAVKDRMLLEQQAKEQAGQSMFSQFIQGFYDYDNTLDRVNERLKEMKTREAALFSVVSGSPTPALNQPQAAMDSQTEKIISANMNSTVDLNLNDPRLSGTSLSPNVKINSSSTK